MDKNAARVFISYARKDAADLAQGRGEYRPGADYQWQAGAAGGDDDGTDNLSKTQGMQSLGFARLPDRVAIRLVACVQ